MRDCHNATLDVPSAEIEKMKGKARRGTERPRGQAKQGQAKRGQAKPSRAKPSKSKTMQDIARVPKFTTKCTLRFRLAAFFLDIPASRDLQQGPVKRTCLSTGPCYRIWPSTKAEPALLKAKSTLQQGRRCPVEGQVLQQAPVERHVLSTGPC